MKKCSKRLRAKAEIHSKVLKPQKLRKLSQRYGKPRWTFLSQNRDGILHLQDISVEALAKKFGTPLYVVMESELRKRFRRFREAFSSYPKLRPQYACKINTNLEVMRIAREEGFEIDASSVGEIILAMLADFRPDQITFTNLYKTEQDIQFAAEVGVQAITADSFEEIEKIIHVGEKLRKTINLFIRVNPMLKLGNYSTRDHQYGIPYPYAKRAIRNAVKSEWINFKGIHTHGGYIFTPKIYMAAAKKLLPLLKFARSLGATPDMIDLGGGFPADYSYRKSFTPEDMGKPFIRYFRKLVAGLGIPLPTLIFEPWKFIATNAMVGLIKVVSCKKLGAKPLVITDGATYGFLPDILIYHWRYDILPANKLMKPRSRRYTIAGCTCDSINIISKNYFMPTLEAGDLLAIMDVGAYSNVMASNFNTLKRAPMVMIKEDGTAKLIRRRDRYSEMFAPELDVLKMADPKELKNFYDLHRRDIDKIWKGNVAAQGSTAEGSNGGENGGETNSEASGASPER
mgnify:CR=1 FL=1